METKNLTPDERNWMRYYKSETGGFEPTIQRDALDKGLISFREFAQANIKWFERWASDAKLRIEHELPIEPEQAIDLTVEPDFRFGPA